MPASCFQTGKFVSESVEEQTEQVMALMLLNVSYISSQKKKKNVATLSELSVSDANIMPCLVSELLQVPTVSL